MIKWGLLPTLLRHNYISDKGIYMAKAKLVLTKHARERMALRRIDESHIRSTISGHNRKEYEDDGDIQFIRNVERNGKIKVMYVIAKSIAEKGQEAWLIKTVWIRGENDPNPILRAIGVFFKRLFGRNKSGK